MREHAQEELSHYSNGTSDIEYEFPFGWGELWGIASRTNFDLTQHIEHSKVDLRYHDKIANEKYIPFVVEPALGVDRLLLVLLCDAYEVEKTETGEDRSVFRFHPTVAPVKAAVLPLSKDDELMAVAKDLYKKLLKKFPVEYDETQSIGKRYRRQDEIGTPYCITIDFGTIGKDGEDKKGLVTIRERDSMKQDIVRIEEVEGWLAGKLG
jgi:glycyl-tRNA synthetase